jgi:hypothetical protein
MATQFPLSCTPYETLARTSGKGGGARQVHYLTRDSTREAVGTAPRTRRVRDRSGGIVRVFPPASHKPHVISPPRDIPPETLFENRELHSKLEAAERRLREKADELRDLRHRLDAESDERRKLTLRLLAPPQPLPPQERQDTSDHAAAPHPLAPFSVPRSPTPRAPSKVRRVWSWIVGKS